MLLHMLWWSLFLICSRSAAAAASPVNRHVILLAGQSNMSGRGPITKSSKPNPSILRLTANLTWVVARDPLHQDIDVNTTCGVGPGISFARRVIEIDPELSPVGLVPCAVGGRLGTKISEWERGTFLYNQLVTRARAALKQKYRGGECKILGMLWYQGESDTENVEDADSYKGRLEKFFTDVRTDLRSPLLPIVQVALASGQGRYIDTVRKAQMGINLENVRYVDAKGLQLLPDLLHLSTKAQIRLGKMLADAFLKFDPKPVTTEAGP